MYQLAKNAFSVWIFLGISLSAQATIVTYTDKELFLSATRAISATGPLPNLGGMGSGPVNIGDLSFTSSGGSLWTGHWTNHHPGNDLAISGPEDLFVKLNSPVYSFGFDFFEPTSGYCGSRCLDSIFNVSLWLDNQLLDSFEFNAANDTLAFIGVSSDQAFDRVDIRETYGTNDDEYYGEFYTSGQNVSVSNLSTLSLMGLGLLWVRKMLPGIKTVE